MNKKILELTYNFCPEGNIESGIEATFISVEVGKGGVIEINEVELGLQHFCVINFKCGKSVKIFNINTITYGN